MLHSDIPYIFTHTNILRNISGQRLLLSGIDMKDKEDFVGKKSHYLQQKLFNSSNNNHKNNKNKCPLCQYQYQEDHDESKQQIIDYGDYNSCTFCPNCCDLPFGLYTVWTALDYFDTPFNSGSMLFCIGSQDKFDGYYQAIINSMSVPTGYGNKLKSEKQKLIWGYANDIKPGDQFIFNIKTLHCSPQSIDGFLRARFDMRVALKPCMHRYKNEFKQALSKEIHPRQLNLIHSLNEICSENEENKPPPQSITEKIQIHPISEDSKVEESPSQTQPLTMSDDGINTEEDDDINTAPAIIQTKEKFETSNNSSICLNNHNNNNKRNRTTTLYDVNNNHNMEPANKKPKISHVVHHKMSSSSEISSSSRYMQDETKFRITNHVRHFHTMSDDELSRKISEVKNKMKRTLSLLNKQTQESEQLMSVANDRYLYTKQQFKEQSARANDYQEKVDNLQKKLIENHDMLFKMFD